MSNRLLKLVDVRIDLELAKSISHTIYKNSITSIVLRSTVFVNSCALSYFLKSCSRIRNLKIFQLPEDADIVIRSLHQLSSLSSLSITCFIDDTNAPALADLLTSSTSLLSLDISSGWLTGEGVEGFSNALAANTTLIELNLSRHTLGNRGAMAIAKVLSTNSVLERLNIRQNSIRDARCISNALKSNSSLKHLDIGGNTTLIPTQFTLTSLTTLVPHFRAASLLAESLRHNTTLTNLNLECEWLTLNMSDALKKGILANYSITSVVGFHDHCVDKHIQMNAHNKRMKEITLFELLMYVDSLFLVKKKRLRINKQPFFLE